jgi:hypothetical protein
MKLINYYFYPWQDDVKMVYTIHSKQEDWSHMLKCLGTKICRDQILDGRCRNTGAEISIR